ncbi:MAG: CDGSH iron-sulfur domain-containing protein [Planctomycetes bacterium]|nr:CDGSH iron-sulfur domain-containing protein [Planctomycetota bacterium]
MTERITIRCRENGPLVLPANFAIVDHLGNEFTLPQGKEVIALCRCGNSKNKPFCDGQHKQVGFQAAEAAVKPDRTGGCETTSGGH